MKKMLCGIAGLMVTVIGGWAGSATNGIVARIAFVSATHINMRTHESEMAYSRRLHQTIAEINAAKVDLVLIGGDLTDGGTREQMALFKRKVKQLQAPVLFVAGNHDVGMVGDGTVKTHITSE